jgi:hypothetical protein
MVRVSPQYHSQPAPAIPGNIRPFRNSTSYFFQHLFLATFFRALALAPYTAPPHTSAAPPHNAQHAPPAHPADTPLRRLLPSPPCYLGPPPLTPRATPSAPTTNTPPALLPAPSLQSSHLQHSAPRCCRDPSRSAHSAAVETPPAGTPAAVEPPPAQHTLLLSRPLPLCTLCGGRDPSCSAPPPQSSHLQHSTPCCCRDPSGPAHPAALETPPAQRTPRPLRPLRPSAPRGRRDPSCPAHPRQLSRLQYSAPRCCQHPPPLSTLCRG